MSRVESLGTRLTRAGGIEIRGLARMMLVVVASLVNHGMRHVGCSKRGRHSSTVLLSI